MKIFPPTIKENRQSAFQPPKIEPPRNGLSRFSYFTSSILTHFFPSFKTNITRAALRLDQFKIKNQIEDLFSSKKTIPRTSPQQFSIEFTSILTPDQKANLNEGKPILLQKDTSNLRTTFIIYQLVDATPLDATAMFWNTKNALEVIPNCSAVSTTEKETSPNSVEATYTLSKGGQNTPVTLENNLQKLENGGYKISWNLSQKSDLLEKNSGSFQAIPQQGKTLLRYESSVFPKGMIAPYILSNAVLENNATKTVNQFINLINQKKSPSAEELASLKKALQN